MGIEQLVDTFKGNPQPLQAKVQKAQQSQPPGFIAPDMEEALALQEILELQKGAQNQQAIQAGGPSPTIMEKLRQMVGTARAQGQPQMGQARQQPMPGAMPQQPVMAARGGSIDQLMSNLGSHYAGGGIIAFDGTKGSKVEDKDKDKEEERTKQREADRRALLSFPAALGDIAQLPIAAGYNLAADAGSGLEGFLNRLGSAVTGEDINTQKDDQVGNKFRFSPTPFTDMLRSPAGKETQQPRGEAVRATDPASIRSQLNAADAGSRSEPGTALPPELSPANVKPTANVSGGGPRVNTTRPSAEPTDPMEVALRAAIMKALGRDENQEFEKGAKQYQDFMGLDKLLAPREARIAEREGMQRKIQGDRLPSWVEGLDRASKPIVSGGIGTILNNLGSGMRDQSKAYSAEDLKFFDQISDMKDEVLKLRMEGKYKAAAAGQEQIKNMLADKRQAESSGTSLLNTKENTRSREQTALDNRLGREAQAAQAFQLKRDVQKERADLQLERLKKGERDQQIKIVQMGLAAQQPAIKEAVKAASTARMVYEAIKDRDPEQAAKVLAKAEEAQHRIDMILAPLSGLAGSNVATAPTGKPAPSTGGAKFLGFEPSKS
jgi:hypothetical protein